MNKHGHSIVKFLVTGSKGNSEVCFPENLNVPRGEAERNIEFEGETKLTVSCASSHKVFCYTFQLKTRKKLRRNRLLDAAIGRSFKEHDLITVRVENSCFFPGRRVFEF